MQALLQDLITRTAATAPKTTALIHRGRELTYADLDTGIGAAAHGAFNPINRLRKPATVSTRIRPSIAESAKEQHRLDVPRRRCRFGKYSINNAG